jgi:hypothetical protein
MKAPGLNAKPRVLRAKTAYTSLVNGKIPVAVLGATVGHRFVTLVTDRGIAAEVRRLRPGSLLDFKSSRG